MSSCPVSLESTTALPTSTKPFWNLVWPRERVQQLCKVAGRKCWHWSSLTINNVWMLLLCKALIGVVSAYDTFLTIKYAESLDIYEQNPLGRWLMGLDQGPISETQQIAAFITAKFLGTLIVLIAIQGLAFWRVKVAGLVATPIALAQLYLALHLLYGDG